MQKKITSTLLRLALLLVTTVPNMSLAQKTNLPDDSSVKDIPFIQETHTAFPVGNGAKSNEVRSIAVDQLQHIWIATADGVFRKNTDSRTWIPVITGEERGPAYDVAVREDGTVLLGTWNGLYSFRKDILTRETGIKAPISVLCTKDSETYALGPNGIWKQNGTQWELQN